ncbi:gamma-interferon-inducible lysosomal thiol reductase-like [Liolophura sinensis]|uniref:gamma-interferon-inducible lysosomal thiol reductase-like n=1 Tax=Liolophura sinensis TaxID=3198878 RepID=UPI00315944AE
MMLYLLLMVVWYVTGVFAQCNLPPSEWCSSRMTAQLCQVEKQCELSGYLPGVSANPGPVNFTLYYESLCPDCQRFFREQMFKAYKTVGQIMNITLVPYGNANEQKDGSKWKFQCQHGPQECRGNLIETCTIFNEKKVQNYLPFIHCMEVSGVMPDEAAEKCAKQFPVDLDSILKCANGSKGNALEHHMALQTDALKPPHQYVPWVTINGVHTEKMEKEAERDLVSLICDTYQGVKPSACSRSTHHTCWRQKA